LPPDEIKKKYPHINYPNDWGAIFDPSGGILLAHTCLTAVQQRLLENWYFVNKIVLTYCEKKLF
jgi:hypothetical protein